MWHVRFVRVTLPLRTYAVTYSCVELLHLILDLGTCLIHFSVESLNNFISLVHHISVTIKYTVPYVSVSPKGSSPNGLSPKGVSLKSSS
jgi:hypothetical protein